VRPRPVLEREATPSTLLLGVYICSNERSRFSLRYEGLRPFLLPQCFHGRWKRKRRPGGRRLSI
jgi:hypothetical protein